MKINKLLRIGTVETSPNKYHSMFIKITNERGYISVSGVIGPNKHGNAAGGCGQIDMEFAHRKPQDDDKRYTNPIKPEEIKFAKGWNKDLWLDLLDFWKIYHLQEVQLPTYFVKFIESLPNADKQPAWC